MPSWAVQILIWCFIFFSVFAKKFSQYGHCLVVQCPIFSFPLTYCPSITSISKVIRNQPIFIINWFVNNINWSKFYPFFTCKFMFYYLIPIKFFYNWTRQIMCYFIFSTFNPFFIKNLNLSLLSKNFKKKLCFANTLFTRKHLSKNPNKALSSWMSSFISSNSS